MSYKPLSDLKKMNLPNYSDSVMLAFAAEAVIALRLLPKYVVACSSSYYQPREG